MPEIKPLKSVSSAARDSGPQEDAPAAPAPTQLAPGPTKIPTLAPPPAAPAAPAAKAKAGGASRLRGLLMVVVPLVALVVAGWMWLGGGRYVTTDNAYVGADKSLITPQVSGPIVAIHVVEGQQVKAGDPLFDIDPAPYRDGADARARAGWTLRASSSRTCAPPTSATKTRSRWAQEAVKVCASPTTIASRPCSLAHAPTAGRHRHVEAALIQARQILEFVRQQQEATKVKLGGGLDATIDKFPDYIQATAQVDDAERNLRHTRRRSRRSPAWRRRCRRSNSAAWSRRGGRSSRSSPTTVCGSTPIPRNRTSLTSAGPAGDGDHRRVPRPRMARQGLLDRARHRRAIRHPAAAKRERQLGQGRAARAAALLLRSPIRTPPTCAPA